MPTLRDNWIAVAIAVAVFVALALLIRLWWQVPKWQMQGRIFKSEKERTDAEDNFRKTVGQALCGGAVLIGAGAAYLQFLQQQITQLDRSLCSRRLHPSRSSRSKRSHPTRSPRSSRQPRLAGKRLSIS